MITHEASTIARIQADRAKWEAARIASSGEATDLLARGWQWVTQAEIDNACHKRPIFNGCTHTYLMQAYGVGNVVHVMGVGWFRNGSVR